MNSFAERYKGLSNADLLKVIDNPSDYQPAAVDAAETELNQRQISSLELEQAKVENQVKTQEKQHETDKKIAFEKRIKDIGFSIADVINPVQKTPPSANRIITILSVIFSALFLYQLFNQFGLLKFILINENAKRGFETLFYFLPLILLPPAIFLFWKRRKSGWMLFNIFFTFSLLAALASFLVALKFSRGVDPIENLLPVPSPLSILWDLLFFGGCLWLIYKNAIRVIYSIDKRAIIISTAIGIILAVLMIS